MNRLKPQAEEIIAKELAEFRKERSTKEQNFNFKTINEKFLNIGKLCTMFSGISGKHLTGRVDWLHVDCSLKH